VHAACADFSQELEVPDAMATGRRLAFFPGSTIGNFEPYDALSFLQRMRRLVQPDGALLIGVDLKKDPQILHAAYNDRQGITAAFNLNLFERLRREFGAELDLNGFRHHAFYSTLHGRIEMHLVSRRVQEVRILGRRFGFEAGESVHTENSYKYTVEEFRALARRAGLWPVRVWCDTGQLFSVHYLSAARMAVPGAERLSGQR
jgi:dimethylhistidine N-methyltransferase